MEITKHIVNEIEEYYSAYYPLDRFSFHPSLEKDELLEMHIGRINNF